MSASWQRVAGLAAALWAGTSAHGQQAVEPPAFLSGCWEQREGDKLVQEQWMAPAGGQMLGISRTLRGTRVLGWEHMMIEAGANGLDFVATPSGKTTTRFALVKQSALLAEFSNPAHGFPATVRYTLKAPGELLAQIAGTSGGKERVIDFNYRRVACP